MVNDVIPAEILRSREQSQIAWIDLAILIARSWKLIAGTVATCTVLAAVGSLLLHNVYTARTILLPPQQAQSSLSMLAGQMSLLSGAGFSVKTPADQYAAMLQTESVQNAIIKKFNLVSVYKVKRMDQARKTLADDTKILVRTKEGLIDVTVTDKDAKRSADIANAYADELFSLTGRLAISEASQRRLFYQRELQAVKADLVAAESAMKQTQEKTGILQVDSQSRVIIETVASLQAQIASQEVKIQGMRLSMTEQSPDLALAQEQIEGMRAQLQKLQSQSGGNGNVEVGTKNVPGASLEYIRAYRELKYQETLFEALAKQYEAARIDEAKSAQIIQVVDVASVPERKSGPKRTLIVLGVAVLAFLLSTFYVICRNAFLRYTSIAENRRKVEQLRSALPFGTGP